MGWFEENAPKASGGGDWFERNAPKGPAPGRPAPGRPAPSDPSPAAAAFDPWAFAQEWASRSALGPVAMAAPLVTDPAFLKGAIVNTARGAFETGKRLLQGPQDAGDMAAAALVGPAGPIARDIAGGHFQEAKRAFQQSAAGGAALRKGDWHGAANNILSGAGHAVAAVIPMIGPAAAAIGEKIGGGELKEGLGELAGLALLPEVGKRAIPGKFAPLKNSNPVEAAAVEWGLRNDPRMVSGLAGASGNTFVKGVQAVSDHSPIGSLVAHKTKAGEAQAFRATGETLAERTNAPVPGVPGRAVSPEQAGGGVRQELSAKVRAFDAEADKAYSSFRRAEADPRNVREVVMGAEVDPVSGRTVPIVQAIPLPVDMAPIQAGLQELYSHSRTWIQPAERNASAGLQAVRSIVEGPRWLQASDAEIGLGALKQLAREGDARSAGMARRIIPELQRAVDSTVMSAGPDALRALQEGRRLTSRKADVSTVLGELKAEPVQAFQQMTWKKDSGIEQLRRIQAEAPDALPDVGRAFLEDLLSEAAAEGGFGHTKRIFEKWRNLGPETKRLLFPEEALRGDLDNFFLLAKRSADNINPSGTAMVSSQIGGLGAVLANPAIGAAGWAGSGALSALLHSPRVVRFMTQGVKVPAKTLQGLVRSGQAAAVAEGAAGRGRGQGNWFERNAPGSLPARLTLADLTAAGAR